MMTPRSPSDLPLLTPPAKPGLLRAAERRTELQLPVAISSLPQTPRSERRATPRVRLEIECEELGPSPRPRLKTRDLSTFGMRTLEAGPRELGARLVLALPLPDGAPPVQVTAEVVGFQAGGLRLAFRRPSSEAVQRLHRFLAERLRRPNRG